MRAAPDRRGDRYRPHRWVVPAGQGTTACGALARPPHRRCRDAGAGAPGRAISGRVTPFRAW